ncbi:hypothetical protein BGZ65_000569, partial [Modicella reniformis]
NNNHNNWILRLKPLLVHQDLARTSMRDHPDQESVSMNEIPPPQNLSTPNAALRSC